MKRVKWEILLTLSFFMNINVKDHFGIILNVDHTILLEELEAT